MTTYPYLYLPNFVVIQIENEAFKVFSKMRGPSQKLHLSYTLLAVFHFLSYSRLSESAWPAHKHHQIWQLYSEIWR